ncbi:MAG: cyclic nucleotide-binding domain-containing protein [Desulfobulbaceae bacterium]|nr:cyclic nucleotide-binding domain-containing protein [Desulfobulbaceae bacterium]
MDIAERIESLRQTDLFNAFSDQELQLFAAAVTEISIAPGEVLFREGEPGQEMFVLVAGALRICKDKRIITMLRPGDYVGEMAILEAKPRSATVEAAAPSRLLKITSDQFRQYLANQPRSLVSMMTTLSRRVRHDTETIAADFEKANILIHDMKNALAVFLYLDLLKKKYPDGETAAFITHMQEARTNLLTMMDEALAGAKNHLCRIDTANAPSSMAALLDDIVGTECTLHPDLRDKKITMTGSGEKTPFAFDRLEMRRALTNLLINAGQASKPGDPIAISFTQDRQYAEVAIVDQGPGIPAELREHIFTPRFTTKATGNGLGLASCKQIIETHHHGSLQMEDNPRGGTIFRLRLPIAGTRSTI